jgi:hypothetical protein
LLLLSRLFMLLLPMLLRPPRLLPLTLPLLLPACLCLLPFVAPWGLLLP